MSLVTRGWSVAKAIRFPSVLITAVRTPVPDWVVPGPVIVFDDCERSVVVPVAMLRTNRFVRLDVGLGVGLGLVAIWLLALLRKVM